MHFGEPWVLFLLWAAPVFAALLWALHRRGCRRVERLVDGPLRAKLCPAPRPWRFRLQFAAAALGLLLGLLAATGPRWGYREERVLQRGRDLVIALDVSRSMLARDVQPSRLERACADVMDLLRALHGDRVGLVAFRGRAVLLCPLTADYSFMETALAEVTVDSAPPGETDLADAIRKAAEAFGDDVGAHRAIILISDGEDLAGRAAEAAAEAARAGIVIFTVGLGDVAGAPIPDGQTVGGQLLHQGREVATRLDHATLKHIAETTGGAYVPVGLSNVQLDTLYRDHLRAISARDLEETSRRSLVERYQWFLAPALLAFLLAAGLSRGRPAAGRPPADAVPRPGRPRAPARALLAWLGCGAGAAPTNSPPPQSIAPAGPVAAAVPPGRAGAAQAWRLYQAGQYQAAADAWRQAAGMPASAALAGGQTNQTPAVAGAVEKQLRHTLLFNSACALYRAGSFKAAAELFAEVASQSGSGDPAGDALYNQGSAWWQAAGSDADASGASAPDAKPADRIAMLENAGKAFQQAARANGDAAAARAALEAVAAVLPQEREEARLQKVLEQYGGKPPAELAGEILRRQRAIAADGAAALTSAPPVRIERMEDLAKQQRDAADLLGPLQMALANAAQQAAGPGGTNAPPPQLDMYFQALRDVMQQTRTRLRDLDPRAPETAEAAGGGVYNLWKELAPFPAVLQEDLHRQTNALAQAQSADDPAPLVNAIRADQAEAQALTELFINRFTNAVPEAGLPSPAAPDGQPADPEQGITPGKRANIVKLAREAVDRQQQALAALNKPDWPVVRAAQQNSHDLLQAIQKLLPPPPPQQQDQQKQDQQQQNQEKQDQKQDQQKQDQQKQDQQKQDQQKQDQQKQDQQKQDQQKQDQQQDQQKQDQEKQDQQQDQQQSDRQEEEQKQAEKQDQPEKEQPEPPQPAATNEQAAAETAEEDDQKEMTPEQARRLLQRAAEREKEYRQRQQRQYAPLSPTDRDW